MTKIDPTPLIAEAQARETALRTKLQAMHRRAQKAEGERDKAKRWAEMLERALQFRRQLNQSTDTALRVALGKIDDAERAERLIVFWFCMSLLLGCALLSWVLA